MMRGHLRAQVSLPRAAATVRTCTETFYIFGGCSARPRARCRNDVHALDTHSLTW